jgi:transposase
MDPQMSRRAGACLPTCSAATARNGAIPGKSNRKKRIRYDKEAYKDRNVVERCFCRLKDWRRIATRYDKLPRNFLSALCCVAMLAYWL